MRKQKDLVHNTEWDYLIILDACRYDYFKEVNWLPGELEPVWSEGSATDTWFPNTFDKSINASLVTAHPFFSSVNPKNLDLSVFNSRHYVEKGTSSKKNGVRMGLCPPEHTTDAVLDLDKDKFMVHYCQPHPPFIGTPEIKFPDTEIYDKVKEGTLSLDFVKEAYRGNLIYVLKEVERLIENVDGKVVITSDHGELLGERGLFGHSFLITCKELRVVPWFVCD